MTTNTETSAPPSVTIDDKKYLVEDLNDKSKLFLSDLTRSVMEYKELLRTYNQSLTLTNTYASGLKTEVEKVGLPESTNEDSPSITIAEKTYDGSDLPDTVKAYVSELVRANQNKTNLEYRLRQLDASRITFINSLKAEVEESGISPVKD
mgnify:FL=1|tara:strand:- start:131 stop:580 length:450 start_codon:yes stop_codon:yes gene_type:complete